MSKNNHPFLSKKLPPDWTAMQGKFLKTDILIAIKEAKDNFKKIKSQKKLTYSNCIKAYENAEINLARAWNYANHLDSVNDNPQLRKAMNSVLPTVTKFLSSSTLDAKLWKQIKKYSQSCEAKKLKGNKAAALREIVNEFVDSGAELCKDDKAKLKELDEQLAKQAKKYSENVLDSTNEFSLYFEDAAPLRGLPESALALAHENAKDKGKTGYMLKLQAPLVIATLRYAESENLRKTIWQAYTNISVSGKFSNEKLVGHMLKTRMQIAALFGEKNWANYVLKRRMAKDGATARAFIESLHDKIEKYFLKEVKELKNFAATFGEKTLKPWNSSYYSEKLRAKKYDFDEEALRKYFRFEDCLKGMFKLSEKLYCLKIKKAKAENVWAKDVGFYEIFDKNNVHICSFYTDFFPRSTKRGGAWMNILSQYSKNKPAICFIGGNINAPSKGKPSLLNHDELCTLFHEFGHLLHFSMMTMPELSLRDVAWDFVELPSQIMENWCWNKECLDSFAKDYKTGEKIPQKLFDKMVKARKFQGAMAFMRQLLFAESDLNLHIDTKKYLGKNLFELAEKSVENYKIGFAESAPSHLYKFTHIFGDDVGYSAGYYSYKWAELLDADAFSRFEKEGIFNKKTGGEFAEKILKVGCSVAPDIAFKNFMGRNPNPEALINKCVEK